jgi:L-fuculose-phosphate aldolase
MSNIMLAEERQSVVDLAQRMVRDRLVVGTSGNISRRVGDHVLLTPSGTDYDTMTAEDIVVVTLDGDRVDGRLNPTVEMPLHLMCYARHDAQAVVHTHSTSATALSLLQDEVPPVHYQLAMFGGSVAVAPYATYGTEALVNNVSNALSESKGAVMKHHGTICIGENLQKAYDRARQLEWLCDVWLRARSVGEPALLPADEMERVVARFLSYGKQPTGTQA